MKDLLHFRRCHVCGAINKKKQNPVEKCGHCQKTLARFCFFDERYIAVQSDSTLRPVLNPQEYHPILGLTVYWEAF